MGVPFWRHCCFFGSSEVKSIINHPPFAEIYLIPFNTMPIWRSLPFGLPHDSDAFVQKATWMLSPSQDQASRSGGTCVRAAWLLFQLRWWRVKGLSVVATRNLRGLMMPWTFQQTPSINIKTSVWFRILLVSIPTRDDLKNLKGQYVWEGLKPPIISNHQVATICITAPKIAAIDMLFVLTFFGDPNGSNRLGLHSQPIPKSSSPYYYPYIYIINMSLENLTWNPVSSCNQL